jgi:hypothetical protein
MGQLCQIKFVNVMHVVARLTYEHPYTHTCFLRVYERYLFATSFLLMLSKGLNVGVTFDQPFGSIN